MKKHFSSWIRYVCQIIKTVLYLIGGVYFLEWDGMEWKRNGNCGGGLP